MPVRLFIFLFLCGWLVCNSFSIGADPPANVAGTANQQQVRQEALSIAKEGKQVGTLAFDIVKQSYQAKRRALDGLLMAAKSKQKKIATLAMSAKKLQDEINFAKARALAETQLITKIISERQAAEEFAVMEVIRQMELENPNFREEALRLAKRNAEQGQAESVTDLFDLPMLNNSLPMTYLEDGIPRDNLVAKISTTRPRIAQPAQNNPDQQAVERAVKQRLALRKVTDIARQIKTRQAEEARKSVETRRQELIDLYKQDKITASEYYRRRHLLDQGQ